MGSERRYPHDYHEEQCQLDIDHVGQCLPRREQLQGEPSRVCSWCKIDAAAAAKRHEGPHSTWCVHFRESQRGGVPSTLEAVEKPRCQEDQVLVDAGFVENPEEVEPASPPAPVALGCKDCGSESPATRFTLSDGSGICDSEYHELSAPSAPAGTAREFYRNDPQWRSPGTEPYTDGEIDIIVERSPNLFKFAEAYAAQQNAAVIEDRRLTLNKFASLEAEVAQLRQRVKELDEQLQGESLTETERIEQAVQKATAELRQERDALKFNCNVWENLAKETLEVARKEREARERAEQELSAIKKKYATLVFTIDGNFECLATCDLYGHDEKCPNMEAAEKILLLAARAERAEAVHHPFCNFQKQPIGGPGCICAVTYRERLKERERAESALREIADAIEEFMDGDDRDSQVNHLKFYECATRWLASLKSSEVKSE